MEIGNIKAELDNLNDAASFIFKTAPDQSFITLSGEMGAGKTTLIKAMVRYLGSEDNVTSPTFSLVNEYKIPEGERDTVYHFDFYRIKSLEEVYDIGYEEYFYSNQYCFIEWPHKVESLLPENYIEIQISRVPSTTSSSAENTRELTIFKH